MEAGGCGEKVGNVGKVGEKAGVLQDAEVGWSFWTLGLGGLAKSPNLNGETSRFRPGHLVWCYGTRLEAVHWYFITIISATKSKNNTKEIG